MPASSVSWAEAEGCAARIPEHVAFRELPRETVLLNTRTGQYHGIDRMGTRFLGELRSAATVAVAAGALTEAYAQEPQRIRDDLLAFCNELLGLGLLELVPAAT